MTPVRLLVDAIHARSGGGVTQLRNLLARLAVDEEFEVHVIIHNDQRALFEPLERRVHWHEVGFSNGFFRRLLWEQIFIPVLAYRLGAEVTYAQANYGPLLAPGLVISLVNTTEVARDETRWSKRFYWAALSVTTFLSLLAARRATAISKHVADKLARFALFSRKITVIPPGIDPLFFDAKAVEREAFLLAVGDFYVQKNYPVLAEAFVRVSPRFPSLRLRIAGSMIDRTEVEATMAVASRAGVEDRVEIMGRLTREELVELYSRCAAFVFPSTAEAFGIPLAEAMAAGAPIACSDRSAMPEVAGDAALYFDPGNAEEIADVIARVLTDRELQQRLIEMGRARALRFDRIAVAAATAEVFKQAAGR